MKGSLLSELLSIRRCPMSVVGLQGQLVRLFTGLETGPNLPSCEVNGNAGEQAEPSSMEIAELCSTGQYSHNKSKWLLCEK